MKIMYEQIDFPGRSAVKVKWQVKPHFTYPWHFHNEYELLYIIDGFGTSFVADNIEHFESGDLVLLGSNLPHFWRSDELYSKEKLNVKYIVVQFPEDFFRDQINHYREFQRIGDLLQRSSRGIRFFPEFVKTISHKITELIRTEDLERILALLHLLQTLAKTSEYRLLAGELYQEMPQDLNSDRLTRILHYINTNYQ